MLQVIKNTRILLSFIKNLNFVKLSYFFILILLGIIKMLKLIKNRQKTKIIGNISIVKIFIKYPKEKTPKQKEMEPLILIFPYFSNDFLTNPE